MTVKQDLKKLQTQYKAMGKSLEKLAISLEEAEAEKAIPKKVTAKETQIAKAKPKAKTAKKVPEKKKRRKMTATDMVLGVVSGRKEGVNIHTLIIKTRFSEQKIQNILYKAKKKGKVKRIGKGVYAPV
jgi:hypothetical protein